MATTKRAPKSKPATSGGAPHASRPHSPDPVYGVPNHPKGLLPWSHVTERMTEAKCYWVCSVDSAHRPHTTPVDRV